MSIFGKFKLEEAVSRLQEEELYAQVLHEMESSLRRDGLWAKALATAGGNEGKARALYIEYRVQSLTDEIEIAKHAEAVRSATAVRERHEEIQATEKTCIRTLADLGFSVAIKSPGWSIREPLGGRVHLSSLAELIEYARVKKIQGQDR